MRALLIEGSYPWGYLFMEVGHCLFCLFDVLRSPKSWCLLLWPCYHWNPSMNRVHSFGFIMFSPIVKKWLNIGKTFHWKFIKSKLNFIKEFGNHLEDNHAKVGQKIFFNITIFLDLNVRKKFKVPLNIIMEPSCILLDF